MDTNVSKDNNSVTMATASMSNSIGDQTEAQGNERREKPAVHTSQEPEINTPVTTDTGWAWMVLLGAVIQMTLNIGITKCSGILFVAIQKKYDSSSSVTSLVTTIQFAVYSITALFVMNVAVKRVGCRTVVMIGGATNAVAFVITALADDIRILFFSHGVLHGIGSACIEPCAYVMVGNYFVKRLGFANSISNSGGSLGALILAPVLTVTLEYYGYTGFMLFAAALMFNCCVSGALFRPQAFYKGRRDRRQSLGDSANFSDFESNTGGRDDDNDETVAFLSNNATRDHHGDRPKVTRQRSVPSPHVSVQDYTCTYFGDTSDMSDQSAEVSFPESTGSPTSIGVRQRLSFREPTHHGSMLSKLVDSISKSNVALYGSSDRLGGSMLILPAVHRLDVSQTKITEEFETTETDNYSICESCLALFDFHLFKNPTFVVFLMATALLCSSNALGSIYIAPYAVDVGLAETDIAQLLTVYGAVDLCARILTGVIADRGWVRRSTIIGLSSIIISVFSHLLRFFVNFQWLMFYAVVLGLFSGVYFCLMSVVIVDYFTVARLHSCIGFAAICSGGGASVTFFLVGYMRDASGSYVQPYHMLGIMGVVGSAMLFCLPLIEKLHKGRQHGQRQHSRQSE